MGTSLRKYYKKTGLLFVLWIFCVTHATAQKEAAEFNIAPQLYDYYQRCLEASHSPAVLSMTDTLFNMAQDKNDARMQAVALCTKLDYYYEKGSDDRVIKEQVENVKRFARETNQPKYYYFAWGKRLITYYIKKGQLHYALLESRRMLDEAMEEDYKPGIMACYGSLGNIYEVKRMMDKAVEYRLMEAEISEKYQIENYNISFLYCSLAAYYLEKEREGKALEMLKKAGKKAHNVSQKFVVDLRYVVYYLNAGEVDKARKLLMKCQQERRKNAKLISEEKNLYETEIVFYKRIKRYDKALNSIRMLEEVSRDRGETTVVLQLLQRKADIYWEMGRREEAAAYYKEYIEKERQQRAVEENISTGEFANLLEVQQLHAEKVDLQQRVQEKRLQNIRVLAYSLGLLLIGGSVFFYRESRMNRQLKKAKERAEAGSRMKTSFIQNMSHEIRTPLNSIIGFSEILTQCFAGNREAGEYCAIIEKNSNNLLRLITDVLDLSDLEQTEGLLPLSVTDVAHCCRIAIDRVKPHLHEGVELISDLPEGEIMTLAHHRRLVQMLEHLLYNASKFTEEGSIGLACRLSDDRTRVLFTVTDTGIGISPEQRERVFERFVKLNEFTQGTGLGLSICRIIAEKMGGSLILDSQYTGGCRFVLSLPYT